MEKVLTGMTVDEAYNLWLLFAHTKDLVFKARRKELSAYGISARHAAVLLAIKSIGDGATASKVARVILREPHTVSELITRMEKLGLVKRVQDAGPGRVTRIVLTDRGHKACADAEKRESFYQIMGALSPEEGHTLASMVKAIRDRAAALVVDYDMALEVPPSGNGFGRYPASEDDAEDDEPYL